MEKRVLIERWLGPDIQPTPIYDEASVSSARQRVRDTGRQFNLDKELTERVALIASELTHNQLAHAKQGYFAVKPITRGSVRGLEIVAADIGPGIQNPTLSLKDKVSTSGSLGAGLAAVLRIADEVEFDNRILEGTCVVARKFESGAVSLCCEVAVMGKPYPGEIISGDDGVFAQSDSAFLAGVSDGLGHGPEARQASNRAIDVLRRTQQMDLDQMVDHINEELASTRGCAMSIVRFNRNDRMLECASVGDVHSHLYNLKDAHFFASTPLILGERKSLQRKARIEKVTVDPGSVLVMFTDGLKSRTSLKGQLDILRKPAIVIADHLLQNDSRPDDDALVLVARFHR
jgi:anti-sigma regulatory factor (Ser/Thr protein kinase)